MVFSGDVEAEVIRSPSKSYAVLQPLTNPLWGFRDPINALTHLIGSGVALLLGVVLLAHHPSWEIGVFIFGITTMLAVSGIYHTVKKSAQRIFFWRRLDHMCIYLLIAATYTPFCLIALPNQTGFAILIVAWVLLLLGWVQKTVWMSAPTWFSLAIYLGMGWMAVILMPELYNAHGPDMIIGIATGGLFYTVGAVVYGLKKPNFFPGYFGFHELWHLFVLGGAFSHFHTIYKTLVPLL